MTSLDFQDLVCKEQGLFNGHESTWLFSDEEEEDQMDYFFKCYQNTQNNLPKDIICRRSDVSVSLLDLDEEEAEWHAEETLSPDFPSPSYHLKRRTKSRYFSLLGSNSGRDSPGSPSSIFHLSPARLSGEEPLFWPLNKRSYREFQGNYLELSPRASAMEMSRRRAASRTTVSSGPRGAYDGKNSGSQVLRMSRGPSRLSRSIVAPQPVKAVEKRDKLLKSASKKAVGVKKKKKKSLVQWLQEFEAGFFQIFMAGKVSVETLMGLEEFKGHG